MHVLRIKRIPALILLLLFCFCNSTCKKIWKYPGVSMYGLWTCNHDECYFMLLEIKKNGRGEYGPESHCGKGAHAKGAVRFTDKALHVGTAGFDFIHKPELVTTNDSIQVNYISGHKKAKIIAKMTLREGPMRGRKTYIFYKIKDY